MAYNDSTIYGVSALLNYLVTHFLYPHINQRDVKVVTDVSL